MSGWDCLGAVPMALFEVVEVGYDMSSQTHQINDAAALLRRIRGLHDQAPICDSWYPAARLNTPNKQHWIGWLSEYDGPGYYGRKNSDRSASFVYNHINSPPMLLWLAEGADVPKNLVEAACRVQDSMKNKAGACALIRRVLPWDIVETSLLKQSLLTGRYDDAFQYAHALHQSQVRKGTTIPYITHLMTVSALVVEHGGSEDQAIAGLLHDAAEDQGGVPRLAEIRTKFGNAVADIVADCTDAWTEPKPPWRTRKEAYVKTLLEKPTASLLVSLADKTHNAEAILFDYRVLGDPLWDRFSGGSDGTRWYYRALSECFRKLMPGGLSDRLSRAVEGFLIAS
jgi:hypothetical protein